MQAKVPEFAQLSPLVHVVLGLNPGKMTLQGTNCYVVGSGSCRLLIDTGQGEPAFLPHLESCLARMGIPQVFEALGSTRIPVYKLMPPDEDPPLFYSCKTIAENQTFNVQGASLTAVYSPGHTSDHVAFYLNQEKSLFSGDCVLGAGTAVFENLKVYMETLETLEEMDIHRIYPGHGPLIEDGKKALRDYISHRLTREAQILAVLKSDPSKVWMVMDIVAIIYAEYPEDLWRAAAHGIVLHLEKLQQECRVVQVGDGWRLVVGNKL